MFGGSPQIIGVKLVEARAPQVQLLSGVSGGQFITTKSGKDFTDQRSAQTVRELAIVFFITAKMCQSEANDQPPAPALRAFRRPPLRSGLLQARRAGECSPLLAHLSGFERTLFAFARNAAYKKASLRTQVL